MYVYNIVCQLHNSVLQTDQTTWLDLQRSHGNGNYVQEQFIVASYKLYNARNFSFTIFMLAAVAS